MAHALLAEWLHLTLALDDTEARQRGLEALKRRMAAFLAAVPSWMTSGLEC
jgi:hypothetical protein